MPILSMLVKLVGGFLGAHNAVFNHAISKAFYWSEEEMFEELEGAGFRVLASYTRRAEGGRAYLALECKLV